MLLLPFAFNYDGLPIIYGINMDLEVAYNRLKSKTVEELILLVNNSTIDVIVKIAKELLVEKGFNLDNLIFS